MYNLGYTDTHRLNFMNNKKYKRNGSDGSDGISNGSNVSNVSNDSNGIKHRFTRTNSSLHSSRFKFKLKNISSSRHILSYSDNIYHL